MRLEEHDKIIVSYCTHNITTITIRQKILSQLMNTTEVDIQSSQQSVRHELMAKSITLQNIKHRQATINFVNQLNLPVGLKELIINHGFTLDLLLDSQPTDLA